MGHLDAGGAHAGVGCHDQRRQWHFVLDESLPELVQVQANAGDITIDAGNASVGRLDLQLNAGRARIILGSAPTTGSISINAGAIDLCVPYDVGSACRSTSSSRS